MKKYLNEVEVSEMTGLAVQTLRNWRHRRKGPEFLKIGNRSIRYELSAIENFMSSHRVKTDMSLVA